jgi:hypothetical protein
LCDKDSEHHTTRVSTTAHTVNRQACL